MKIKIVYNTKTGIIPRHTWNENGTVSILGSDKDVVVAMIEPAFIDFENCIILLEEMNAKEKENRT